MKETEDPKGETARSLIAWNTVTSVWCPVCIAMVLGVVTLFSADALALELSPEDQSQLQLRIEPMLVTPLHGPMLFVVVKNRENSARCGTARCGTLTLKAPDQWLLSPKEQTIDLAANQVGRFGFNVQHAMTTGSNTYPLEVIYREKGKPPFTYKQNVVVATSPYFKPVIDGKIDDWKDAVPVCSITGKGIHRRKTIVKTFWNRRAFSVLIEVEEDQFTPAILGKSSDDTRYGDAVQVAFGAEKPGLAKYEYLIVANGGEGEGICYRLEKEGKRSTWVVAEKAKCFITRDGKVTRYECSIPFIDLAR